MSDPMKDGMIRQQRRLRERVANGYTPLVVWVKPGHALDEAEWDGNVAETVRREIRDRAADIPFVDVMTNTTNEPRVRDVVTEFDEVPDDE